jgi:predicted 3-demethylubiquinone-9 3-methyltransferase (glyoxalase superfamily)
MQPKITPFLWFDGEAEEAAQLYTSTFPNSRIKGVSRYGEAGPGTPGSVMTVEFELDGQRFVALNGGPEFSFTEAVSFQIDCETQEEIDHYWSRLGDDGEHGPCGWLKDRFGLSWQVVPSALPRLLSDSDREKSQRVMAAMLEMSKLEIAGLEAAAGAVPGRASAA